MKHPLRTLRLASAVSQGMTKTAEGKVGVIRKALQKLWAIPGKAGEKVLVTPFDLLLGKMGKKAPFKGTRYRPRPGSSMVPISSSKAVNLKRMGHPVHEIDGKYYTPKGQFGGAAGVVQRHPILTGGAAAMYLAGGPQRTPSETAYRAVRQQVGPMAPYVPEGYRL